MANTNVALGKPVTANASINPYSASRAVDGNITTPAARWLSNQVPAWLQVNLGAIIFVNRWVVRHLSSAGFQPGYCLSNYSLQVSQDGAAWTTVDSVTGNAANMTDRTFAGASAAYARVVASNGMTINPALASLVEFELYGLPATSNNLSGLVFSSGALQPAFLPALVAYAQSVSNDTESLTVTPTTEDPNATVVVNGTPVPRGQASSPVLVSIGANTVTTRVTPVIGLPKDYVVTVTRSASAYLSNITLKNGRSALSLNTTFDRKTMSYTCAAGANPSVVITPTAETPTATILVNTQPVTSGQPATAIPLAIGTTTATIQVTSPDHIDVQTYSIVFTRSV